MKFLGPPSSGSIAGTTYGHNRGGQYQRNRRAPSQPVGTGRRATARTNFGAASSNWAALTLAQQMAWASYADGHPVTDALGQSIKLTGHQMYTAVNAQLLNCGSAIVAVPPTSDAVFSAGTPTFTAVHAGAITLTPTGLGTAADFLCYAFSKPQSGGRAFNKVFWQAGHVAGNSVAAIVATTAYNNQFGSPVAGQRIFVKATPVNQYGVRGVPYIGFCVVT